VIAVAIQWISEINSSISIEGEYVVFKNDIYSFTISREELILLRTL